MPEFESGEAAGLHDALLASDLPPDQLEKTSAAVIDQTKGFATEQESLAAEQRRNPLAPTVEDEAVYAKLVAAKPEALPAADYFASDEYRDWRHWVNEQSPTMIEQLTHLIPENTNPALANDRSEKLMMLQPLLEQFLRREMANALEIPAVHERERFMTEAVRYVFQLQLMQQRSGGEKWMMRRQSNEAIPSDTIARELIRGRMALLADLIQRHRLNRQIINELALEKEISQTTDPSVLTSLYRRRGQADSYFSRFYEVLDEVVPYLNYLKAYLDQQDELSPRNAVGAPNNTQRDYLDSLPTEWLRIDGETGAIAPAVSAQPREVYRQQFETARRLVAAVGDQAKVAQAERKAAEQKHREECRAVLKTVEELSERLQLQRDRMAEHRRTIRNQADDYPLSRLYFTILQPHQTENVELRRIQSQTESPPWTAEQLAQLTNAIDRRISELEIKRGVLRGGKRTRDEEDELNRLQTAQGPIKSAAAEYLRVLNAKDETEQQLRVANEALRKFPPWLVEQLRQGNAG